MGATIMLFLKKPLVIVALTAIVIGLAVYAAQEIRISNLQEQNGLLTNTLADHDSLRLVLRVAQGANITLSERHARVEENLHKSISREKDLMRYIKKKDGTILSLTQIVSELRIENQTIKGERTSDSTAVFQSAPNPFYSLSAGVLWNEHPELFVESLTVQDSSYVGTIETHDGYYLGFITRTNPFIHDRGATFRINKERTTADATSVSLLRYRGLWASGRLDFLLGQEAAIGVGLEILGVETSPYVKLEHRDKKLEPGAGIKLRIGGN